MKPEFDQYHHGHGAELLCPSCGFNYLHHDRVDVFERSEDATQGLHIAVEEGGLSVGTSLKGNPSGRRHGITIRFWCEGCKATPVLSIAQHKGNTYVDFTHSGEPNDE